MQPHSGAFPEDVLVRVLEKSAKRKNPQAVARAPRSVDGYGGTGCSTLITANRRNRCRFAVPQVRVTAFRRRARTNH